MNRPEWMEIVLDNLLNNGAPNAEMCIPEDRSTADLVALINELAGMILSNERFDRNEADARVKAVSREMFVRAAEAMVRVIP